jgi:hypothetical protein
MPAVRLSGMPVNLAESNLRVRRGTADDLTNLVGIYVQLEALAKDLLWADVMGAVAKRSVKYLKAADGTSVDAVEWLATLLDTSHPERGQCAHLIVRIRRLVTLGLCGSVSEITTLMEVYRWFFNWPDGGWSVLVGATEALAAQRIHGLEGADNMPVTVEDWLGHLAEDAYPRHEPVDYLLIAARDWGMGAKEPFQEGILDMVLCDMAGEDARGEGMYESYKYAISMLDAYRQLVTPQEVFGIKVKEADYTTFDGNDWVLDEDARQEEIDRLCLEQFIQFVGYWRDSFFTMLIASEQPIDAAR